MYKHNVEIYTELLYEKSRIIDVSWTEDAKIFEKSGFDPRKITIRELLWCAEEIANTLDVTTGVTFLTTVITIASRLCMNEKKEKTNG